MNTDAREHVLDHVYKLFYDDLSMCGCGNPEDAYELVRALLELAPFYDRPHDEVAALIGTSGAYHMVLSTLTTADVLEHGSSIGGSWLTPKGEWYRTALRTISDWEQLEDPESNVGLPHDGAPCTEACWSQPVPAANPAQP